MGRIVTNLQVITYARVTKYQNNNFVKFIIAFMSITIANMLRHPKYTNHQE